MLSKKDRLVYLMQQDKDSVYTAFVSDSLAFSNLYKQLHTHPNCACLCVCVPALTSWLHQLLFIPHASFIYSNKGPLSQNRLRYLWSALPSPRLFLDGHGRFIVMHKPVYMTNCRRVPF